MVVCVFRVLTTKTLLAKSVASSFVRTPLSLSGSKRVQARSMADSVLSQFRKVHIQRSDSFVSRKVGLDVTEAQHLMDGLDGQGAVKDIQASVQWPKANGSQKVGVTGSRMGGALTIASSVLSPGVDVAVAFYEVPPPELADPAQDKAPLEAHFGELDSFVGFQM